MRYVLSGTFLAITVVFILGAAQPFERVPAGAVAYDHLNTVAEAGLLTDFDLPSGELSRLEFAVLIQQGLREYGQAQLAGSGPQVAVETALGELLGEFAAELAQVGSPVSLAGNGALGDVSDLERRVTYLEEEVEDVAVEENEAYFDALYNCDDACEAPVEDAIEIGVYGEALLQVQGESISYVDPEAENYESSVLDLYDARVGVTAADGAWSGCFGLYFDDEEDDVTIDAFWGRYDHPTEDWYFQLGRYELPFAVNDWYFPGFPATYDLGAIITDAAGVGYEGGCWGIAGWLYNPRVDILDEEDNFSDFAVVWDVTAREADVCHDGWRLVAGYNSHLAESHHHLVAPAFASDRTGGYNVFGRYDWGDDRYHLLADYVAAAEELPVADSDVDADGVGDQPTALNLEFVYEPVPDTLWGVGLEVTEELADYAETRYAVMYGERLSELVMFKVEYSHGEYGEFVTEGQDTDDTLTAELGIAF